MPILQTEIQRALRQVGLRNPSDRSEGRLSEGEFHDRLDGAGLTLENTLAAICGVMVNGDNDSTKLKAAEIILKARGHLKEVQPAPPVVNIVINDNGGSGNRSVNAIIFPRPQVITQPVEVTD